MDALGFALQLDDRRSVHHTIQHRHCQRRIAQILTPSIEVNVRHQRLHDPRFLQLPHRPLPTYEYGRVFADLKRRGRPMQQVDMMLAAIALTLGNCIVVSGDGDFTAVPGLTVENWAS